MTWAYSAGTTTPTWAGLVELATDLRVNDGSFRSNACPGLFDTAPIDVAVSPLPSDDGGHAGSAFYRPREFSVQGFIEAAQVDDLFAAEDYLRGRLVMPADQSLDTIPFQRRGWAAKRQVSARLAGPVLFTEPDIEGRRLPRREFAVPMIAPDMFVYATTDTTVTMDYAGTVFTLSHNGSVPTRFTVRFNGPVTNPSLQFTLSGRVITYNGSITAGNWVEVTTNPANPSGITALNQAGANVYGSISRFDAYTIVPNTSRYTAAQKNWKVTGTGTGAGVPTVTFRDTWA